MIQGIHHVQMTIPKGKETEGRRFYCDLLGLREIEKPASLTGRGGFWLDVGDREVHVGTENDVDRMKSKAHIAYQVDDITYWQTKLAKHGVTTFASIPIPGFKRFEFRDPFGNRVEMIQVWEGDNGNKFSQ